MRLLLHVGRLVVESVRFSFATRRVSMVAVVLIGLLLLALSLSAQAAAPVLIYPFA